MCSVSQGSKKVTFGAWRPQEGLVRRMLALASSNFPPCRCGNFYLRKFFDFISIISYMKMYNMRRKTGETTVANIQSV